MRFLLTFVLALAVSAGVVGAQTQYCYGWEDGGTILGAFLPDQLYAENSSDQARTGNYSLEIYELEGSGTPAGLVAWIPVIEEGDEYHFSFWTLDLIEGFPSCRIWAGYTEPVENGGHVEWYRFSAGGNNTYSGGEDWVELTHSVTVPANRAGFGLRVEVRTYNGADEGEPWLGSNWVDDLCVTIPEGRTLYFPGGVIQAENSSLTEIKSLFR
jgi:hypothetical protein